MPAADANCIWFQPFASLSKVTIAGFAAITDDPARTQLSTFVSIKSQNNIRVIQTPFIAGQVCRLCAPCRNGRLEAPAHAAPSHQFELVRRAYIEGHAPCREGFRKAVRWAGDTAAVLVGDTGTVANDKWLKQLGIPITSASSRSRFHGTPRGTVIGAFLNLTEVLELERSNHADSIIVVPANGRH